MSDTAHDGRADDARQRLWSGRLFQNAVALMLSAGGTAVLGVVFWGFAAHLTSPASIGHAYAEIAAMVLIANLAQLSFGSIFERFLPVAGTRTRSFVLQAYALCAAAALIGAIFYLYSGLGRRVIPTSLWWHLTFIVVVLLWTFFILQDSVLIGLRASKWVPVENILFALAKLALLPAFLALSSRQGLFMAWCTPVAFAVGAVTWYLFKRRIPHHESLRLPQESLPRTKELILLAGAQYATLVSTVLTPSIVTLIVIDRIGAVANAHYSVPALIVGGLSLFNISIVRSFLVEAVSEPHRMRHHANVAIEVTALVLVPCVTVGCIFAPDFLRIFGDSYATHGTTLFRMLLLSLPLGAVSIFYSTFAWIDRRVWWMAIRDVITLVIYFTILLLYIRRDGINAIGYAALISAGLQCLIFLPAAIRRYQRTSNGEPPIEGAAFTPS